MKAINPRTNEVEDCELLVTSRETLVRFSDGLLLPKRQTEFVDEFNEFIDVTDEDLPGDTLESLIFRAFVAIGSSLFFFALVYLSVQTVIWLVQKFI